MNVQPNASVVGATGTAKAQQNTSDGEVSQQNDSLKRAAAPGASSEGDSLSIGESSESEDRGADGRQVIARREREELEADEGENLPDRERVSLDGDGEELDFEA